MKIEILTTNKMEVINRVYSNSRCTITFKIDPDCVKFLQKQNNYSINIMKNQNAIKMCYRDASHILSGGATEYISIPESLSADFAFEVAKIDNGFKEFKQSNLYMSPVSELPQFTKPEQNMIVNKSRTHFVFRRPFYDFVCEQYEKITKSGPYTPGEDIKYTLKWLNRGSDLMELVVITDLHFESGVEIFHIFEKLLASFKLSDKYEYY